MNEMPAQSRYLLDRGVAAGDIPRYRSEAFEQLAESDPRRVASYVVAAEVWFRYCSEDQIVAEMTRDVASLRGAYLDGQASVKDASVAICEAVDWSAEATRISDAARARDFRAQMLRPRDTDFPGRAA